MMKTGETNSSVLTINGGSSSIKFALFEADPAMRRIMTGKIEGIGLQNGRFVAKGDTESDNFSRSIVVPDHAAAVNILMDWIQEKIEPGSLAALAHRVVHGGPKYWKPQRISPAMIEELRQLSPFDPEHL